MGGIEADKYIEAMKEEITNLKRMNTWILVDREPHMKVLKGTWAFKLKRTPDGVAYRHRSRFCVRGDQQEYGVNYFETFAPVVQWSTIRLLLILILTNRWKTRVIDYTNAFPQANIDTDIFAETPALFGSKSGEDKVLIVVPTTSLVEQMYKDFENYGTVGASIYNDHQSKLELDNINLLYVALTRAVEQLYVVGNASVSKKGDENLKTYSGLLINYLRTIGHWEASKLEYEFGVFEKIDSLEPPKYPTEIQTDFISTPKAQLNVSMATNAGYLWDTSQKEAIEKGNLIHLLLSKVYTKSDIEITFNHFINTGVISKEQGKALRQTVEDIVSHPKLSIYYSSEVTVFNEREIMTESGKIIIPDRLVVFKDQTAVIIDYKTGDFYNKHKLQLIDYAEIIEQMGYKVSKKLLVYTEISLQIHDF